jgi:N-methylhydantoinase B/oxoprolinase/acetone carboxylase alpha subunit
MKKLMGVDPRQSDAVEPGFFLADAFFARALLTSHARFAVFGLRGGRAGDAQEKTRNRRRKGHNPLGCCNGKTALA